MRVDPFRAQVPKTFRTRARQRGLESWVCDGACDLEGYFEFIGGLMNVYVRLHQPAVLPEKVVAPLALVLNEDESFYTFLSEQQLDTTDEAEWKRDLETAAWLITERYYARQEEQ